jgi:hypothetical protein
MSLTRRAADVVVRVKRIGGRPAGALEPIAERADRLEARGSGRASLFIDDGATQVPPVVQADLPVNANAILAFDEGLVLNPAGATVTIKVNGVTTTISDGAFSIPLQPLPPPGGPVACHARRAVREFRSAVLM